MVVPGFQMCSVLGCLRAFLGDNVVNSAMVGLGQNVLWSLGYAYILAKSEFSIPVPRNYSGP